MIAIGTLFFGYALFYWGLHHFPAFQRYSLWTLLGIGGVINAANQPLQFKKGGGITGGPSTGHP
jgi:hypothetical protein